MATRFGIGAVLIAALAGVLWLETRGAFEHPFVSRALLWVFTLGALHELLTMAARRIACGPGLFFFGAVAVLTVVVPYVAGRTMVPMSLLLLAAFVAGGIRLLGMAPLRSAAVALPEAALLTGAIVYTAGLASFLDRIFVTGGPATAFAVIAVSKTSDIGGYVVGTLVGRRRIAPAVSPKKSWEGTIAGVLASFGVAALLSRELVGPPLFAGAIGALLAVASLFGDLIESGIKRWAGVKDSATLIPQFGGFLDMLDGILVAAPVAALSLYGS
jgi:CDP-diglyceride synthetase